MQRTLTIALVAIFLVGCWDYSIALPGGYELTRFHSGSTAITQNGQMVLGPSTYGVLIAVKDEFVVGNLDTAEEAYGAEDIPDRYFILNTAEHWVQDEMTEAQFVKLMAKYGLEDVVLKRPNRLTRYAT